MVFYCCSPGCYNCSRKGFALYQVPEGIRNELRRKRWLKNLGISENDRDRRRHLRVCEVHFTKNQFKEGANRKKLKRDAIPKEKNENNGAQNKLDIDNASIDEDDQSQVVIKEGAQNKLDNAAVDEDGQSQVVIKEETKPSDVLHQKHIAFDPALDQTTSPTSSVGKVVNAKDYKNRKQLQDEVLMWKARYQNLKRGISTFLNEDQQILVELGRAKSTKNWTDETLLKSFELKAACGTGGYEALIASGFPLPSVRTLQRRMPHKSCDSPFKWWVLDINGKKIKLGIEFICLSSKKYIESTRTTADCTGCFKFEPHHWDLGNDSANVFVYQKYKEATLKVGKIHLVPVMINTSIEVVKPKAHLDGLFNGNEALNQATNKAINNNVDILFDELKPVVEPAMIRILEDLLFKSIIENIPWDELYPANPKFN